MFTSQKPLSGASVEWVVVVSITTMEFWAKVNDAMTDEERTAFNEWRDKLWAVGDRIRDESRRATASIAFNSDAGELMRAINEVPHLRSR
jgi:hypothetical protein